MGKAPVAAQNGDPPSGPQTTALEQRRYSGRRAIELERGEVLAVDADDDAVGIAPRQRPGNARKAEHSLPEAVRGRAASDVGDALGALEDAPDSLAADVLGQPAADLRYAEGPSRGAQDRDDLIVE